MIAAILKSIYVREKLQDFHVISSYCQYYHLLANFFAHCTYTFNVMIIFLHNFISIFIRVLRIGVYIDIRALDI